MKSENLLESFNEYCKAHPEERFWQALRNWSGYAFIYATDKLHWGSDLRDTFFWTQRSGPFRTQK